MSPWIWRTKITAISCCRCVFITCKGDKDMNQLQQHLQIPHAKRHPVPHTGKSTADAVSMTTQPGDNRFYFFPSVLNPNPLPQEKKKGFFFICCLKIALRGAKWRWALSVRSTEKRLHITCQMQMPSATFRQCSVKPSPNWIMGQGLKYHTNLSSFMEGIWWDIHLSYISNTDRSS